MSVSAPGIGSGLDVQGIVNQLMQLERRPLVALQQREAGFQAQISAYGGLKSALESFRTAMTNLGNTGKFQVHKATSGNEKAFTATASSSANIGSYSVEVVGLAAAHRMASAAVADSDTTTIGNDGDKMRISAGDDDFTIEIGGKTLDDIRSAINSHADNSGITASLLKSEDGYHLILSSSKSGTANGIGLDFTDVADQTIADPLTMGTTVAATDAEIRVDGAFTIKSSTNTFTGAIEGVTLTAKETTTSAVSLDIGRDINAIKKSAQEFADAYNALRNTISDLRGRALKGDSTLLSIERTLRGIINTPPSGIESDYQYLAQVGLALDKDGRMKLDGSRFEAALDNDFAGVAQLFANNDQGYAYRLRAMATDILDSSGPIDSRRDGINSRIKTNQAQQERLSYRLEQIEQRYRQQFNSLDAMLGQMQATSNYLTQQLSFLTPQGRY